MTEPEILSANSVAVLEQRLKEIGEARKSLDTESASVRARIKRLTVVALTGVPDGVRHRFSDDPHIMDRTGTVVQVRRSRASVKFGGVLWDIPIDHLIPAGQAQGFRLPLFGEKK